MQFPPRNGTLFAQLYYILLYKGLRPRNTRLSGKTCHILCCSTMQRHLSIKYLQVCIPGTFDSLISLRIYYKLVSYTVSLSLWYLQQNTHFNVTHVVSNIFKKCLLNFVSMNVRLKGYPTLLHLLYCGGNLGQRHTKPK